MVTLGSKVVTVDVETPRNTRIEGNHRHHFVLGRGDKFRKEGILGAGQGLLRMEVSGRACIGGGEHLVGKSKRIGKKLG